MNYVWIVMVFFLFLILNSRVFASDRGVTKTPREMAILGARAVPVIETSCDVDGERVETNGSGFFINSYGQLITNAHVVMQESETWRDGPRPFWLDKHPQLGTNYKYKILLPWVNKVFEARLLSFNKYKDLAKLQVIGINARDYDVLPWGKIDTLLRGDSVFCIGSSGDFVCSITSGIVSGLHRNTGLNYIEDTIQVDATIENGNSGGPLINAYGEIVGVIYAKEDHFGLVIPIDLVKGALDDYEVEMAYLGLDLETAAFPRGNSIEDLFKMSRFSGFNNDDVIRKLLKLTQKNGVIISDTIDERTLAARMGLRRGDVIRKLNGKLVKDKMHFRVLQAQIKVDEPTILKVIRVALEDSGDVKVKYFKVIIDPSCD